MAPMLCRWNGVRKARPLGLPRASLRSHVPSGRREAVGASPARRGRMRKFPVCLKKVPGRIFRYE